LNSEREKTDNMIGTGTSTRAFHFSGTPRKNSSIPNASGIESGISRRRSNQKPYLDQISNKL
jgi:hypothetical protein